MRIEESYSFPQEEAQQRVKALVDYWQKKHGLNVNWQGSDAKVTGKVMGVTIDATVSVQPGKVVADGKDPGLMFRGAATSYLKKKFGEYFDPNVTVADLASRSA